MQTVEHLNTTDLLQQVGLDWNVQRRVPFFRTERNADTYHKVDGYHFLTHSGTGKVLGVVSDKYKPHQNYEIISFFREWAESVGAVIDNAGALKGGRLVYAQARTTEREWIGADEVKAYITLSTAHDGTATTKSNPTSICIVCENTFQAARSDSAAYWSVRHNYELTSAVMSDARQAMDAALGIFRDEMVHAKHMAGTPVNQQQTQDFVLKLVQPDIYAELDKRTARERTLAEIFGGGDTDLKLSRRSRGVLESILNSPGAAERKGTAWGLLQGVTHYVDHVQGREADTAKASAWFGQGAKMKQRAAEITKELVYA